MDLVISAKRLDNDRIYGKCYGRGTSALGMISRSGKAQQDIQEEIDEELPDLVTAAPPPRTWASWLNIAEDQAMADLLRAGDLPLWKLARTVWARQGDHRALALAEQPLASEAPNLPCMATREALSTTTVDQCMLNPRDPETLLCYRKKTALDTNDEICASTPWECIRLLKELAASVDDTFVGLSVRVYGR